MSHYVIRGGVEGKKRLEVLAQAMWPTTSRLLERAGLAAGMRCLDLGCGGGDVTLELARHVGPSGEATGLDMDKTKLELARETALARGLRNTRFRQADIGAWDDERAYDLIYCRFLLTHLSDPAPVLARMWQAARAGGSVVVEDIDFTGSFCHPACTAYERYLQLYRMVVARRGGDADIGPKLYGLARRAGWRDVQVDVVQPTFVAGPGKQIALLTLVNVADAILEERLATEPELEATLDELARFSDAPDTLVSLPRVFQIWARRD
jgi:SAM-dependent methyltransferase